MDIQSSQTIWLTWIRLLNSWQSCWNLNRRQWKQKQKIFSLALVLYILDNSIQSHPPRYAEILQKHDYT